MNVVVIITSDAKTLTLVSQPLYIQAVSFLNYL